MPLVMAAFPLAHVVARLLTDAVTEPIVGPLLRPSVEVPPRLDVAVAPLVREIGVAVALSWRPDTETNESSGEPLSDEGYVGVVLEAVDESVPNTSDTPRRALPLLASPENAAIHVGASFIRHTASLWLTPAPDAV